MLNGSTLKICFLMIVITMCLILLIMVAGVVWFKFPLEDSKLIIGMLGTATLFGSISQAFIHSNIVDASNKQANVAPSPIVTTITPIVAAPTSAQSTEGVK